MNIEAIRGILSGLDSKTVAPFIGHRVRNFKKELEEKGISVTPIQNLSEVLEYPPFIHNNPTQNKPVVICDVHGVLTNTWKAEPNNGFRSLLGLTRLAVKSREIIFTSSGIKLNEEGIIWQVVGFVFGGNLAKLPFWTDQTTSRLESLVHKANPECDVKFVVGITDKLFNLGRRTAGVAAEILQSGTELVVIGSSFTDRNMVRRLIKTVRDGDSLKNLYYFDTRHLII